MKLLLRTGAAAAGLVLACSAFAAPAFADTTADLGVTFDGTTIAAGSDGKFGVLSLTNAGPSDVIDPLITIDVSELDLDAIEIDDQYCDAPEDGVFYCGIASDTRTLPAGADFDWPFPLFKKPGAESGSAGKITVTIAHDGTDPNPANNAMTAEVVLSEESGVDLLAWAPDVYQWDDEAEFFTEEPIVPGGTSRVYVEVLNQGDAIADGIKVQVQLPEHATLAEPEPDCEFSADLRSATCEYKQVSVAPFFLTGIYEKFYWKINVSEDATGPALKGGSVRFDAINVKEAEQEPTVLRGATADLPEQFQDVDDADNSDGFSVFVADTSGGGGGLPVTGPAATAIAGGGAAVLALGLVLFVSARRRRIVTQA